MATNRFGPAVRTFRRAAGGRQRRLAALAGMAVVALLSAGCAEATNSLNPGQETITTAHSHDLGTILTDEEGRTLYLFVQDPPNHSACYGACASVWPPVTTASMAKADGIATSKLTAIHRSDGSAQVAYGGHPLYYYQADTGRGDVYGEGLSQFGAEWYAISPAGQQVEPKGSGSSGS